MNEHDVSLTEDERDELVRRVDAIPVPAAVTSPDAAERCRTKSNRRFRKPAPEVKSGTQRRPEPIVPDTRFWHGILSRLDARKVAVAVLAATILMGLLVLSLLDFDKKAQPPSTVALNHKCDNPVQFLDSGGVVVSGARFSLNVTAETRHPYGWVYHVRKNGEHFLTRLDQRSPGLLAGIYSGTYDKNDGYEYFVVILADQDILGLNSPTRFQLTALERLKLQEHASNGEEISLSEQVLADAVRKLAPGVDFEIRGTQRFLHVTREP